MIYKNKGIINMRKILFTALCALFVSVIGVHAQSADSNQKKDLDAKYAVNMLKSGAKAPDFKLKTYDGKLISLSQYRGSYVVLDFWASWCPDCRRDIPAMKALYEQFRDHGVQFIGISFDTDREVWAKTYWNRYQMNWTQVSELKKFRKETNIDKIYRIDWIPSMYLVDPYGKIVLGTVEIDKLKAKLEEVASAPKISKTDVLPTFEGGQDAIDLYFTKAQRPSITSFRAKAEMDITVVFNVEMDGTVTGARVADVKNARGTSKRFMKMEPAKQQRILKECVDYYKEQAVRLTNNMPKWIPAQENGRPVQSRTSLTIAFRA